MKKILLSFSAIYLFLSTINAQETIYPAKNYDGKSYIVGGSVHIGDGKVLPNATIVIDHGKITEIGSQITIPASSDKIKIYQAEGKQVYPGLILSDTDLGLKEIANAVPGSDDYDELGDFNSDVRSLVAYDAASMVIGTLRTNGILLASVSPQGGTITGVSSVVQLDAWNWEDAAYKTDNNLHIYLPSFSNRANRPGGYVRLTGMNNGEENSQEKKAIAKLEELKSFFKSAQSYYKQSSVSEHNLKFESIRALFDRKQKLFIHADEIKQMMAAISLAKEFNIDVVIVGGRDSWMIADILKQNNIAIILKEGHSLPASEDDDFDQPYKTPFLLQKAGVLFAINDTHDETRYRNLMFNAGTASAYGLTKEEALAAITSSPAKILGIEDKTGTIEVGKDANIVISEGDILDMKTSVIQKAFIQGRDVSLENKQTQMYDRYKYKYGIQ